MSTEIDVYRELQRHLDRLAIGFPPTESGVDLRILKHLFAPEEARIAMRLSMLPEPLSPIYRRVRKTGMTIGKLEQSLDAMVKKGIVSSRVRNGKKHYSNEMLAVGMYEHQVDRLTRGFAEDMLQYLNEAFATELNSTRIPQLRTIPIEKAIPQEYSVATYDKIRDILGRIDSQIVVANCVCRQAKDVVGDRCHQTDLRETCLIFGSAAQHYLDMGLAHPISRDEAFDILRKAEDAGLVLQPINSQHPQAVCCCCGDCCGLLMAMKKHPHPAELCGSTYYAEVDADLCNACQACVDRCQMQAMTLLDDVCKVNRDRCIGCGICVANCTTKAVRLHRKERISLPPESTGTTYANILARKFGKWHMVKLGMKRMAGRQV